MTTCAQRTSEWQEVFCGELAGVDRSRGGRARGLYPLGRRLPRPRILIQRPGVRHEAHWSDPVSAGEAGAAMFENKTRVLLTFREDVLGRARMFPALKLAEHQMLSPTRAGAHRGQERSSQEAGGGLVSCASNARMRARPEERDPRGLLPGSHGLSEVMQVSRSVVKEEES